MSTSISDRAEADGRRRTPADLSGRIAGWAGALGFDAAGIADPAALGPHAGRLRAFLDAGWHGDMDWQERRVDQRGEPARLWPEVRSVVVLAMNYGPADDPLRSLAQADRGTVSVYARNRDYHDLVKGRLKHLAQQLVRHTGCSLKVFVDTAPVPEKALAALAGIGWQGKHTNLVSRRLGSWLFLGAIYTDLDLVADAAHADRCGSCRRCLDACPTDAFPAPYQLDARRCISYLTIEHAGPIPRALRPAMGNRIYGCDDCLAVCPWNRFAKAASEIALQARDDLAAPPLADLAALDDAGFRRRFSASPVKRIGRDRFVRNVLVAIGNSGRPDLADSARDRLDDASPLVRGAAAWVFRRLAPPDAAAPARVARLAHEPDADVRAEWLADLPGQPPASCDR